MTELHIWVRIFPNRIHRTIRSTEPMYTFWKASHLPGARTVFHLLSARQTTVQSLPATASFHQSLMATSTVMEMNVAVRFTLPLMLAVICPFSKDRCSQPHLDTHTHTHTHIYIRTYKCTCIHTCAHTRNYTHTEIRSYTRSCAHVNNYTQTFIAPSPK